MNEILDNIRVLLPIMLISWGIVIVFTIWKPQRYFNSFLLMIACGFTMLFLAGLFGDNMGYALVIMFILFSMVLFAVPALLVLNGIVLLRKEGFALAHILSLILGIGIGIGEIATVIYVLSFRGGIIVYDQLSSFMSFIGLTVFYFSSLVLCFVIYSIFIQVLPHRYNFNYIIIHGCGLSGGERVTKLLSDRIDKAVEVYERCRVKPMIIPSGGKGSDEKVSEAYAMKKYLMEERNIPEDHIIMEDRSTTTMENLKFSKEIIDSREGKKKTALVSSNYHVYRCLKYAKKIKFRCVGIGAHVAFYYWPSALIREFIAVFLKKGFLFWSLLGYLIVILPYIYIAFSR